MPEISRFLGIVIKMFADDHNPPHFHAYYAEHEAVIEINGISIFAGRLPPRAVGLVLEWTTIHQQELLDDWDRAQNHQPLVKIEPLQ